MLDSSRRDFVAFLSSAILFPFTVEAQQARPVIGFLVPTSFDTQSDRLRALRQGLNEAGFVEGENLRIEYRWADGNYDRLPVLAGELVRDQVSVIVTVGGTPTALAAKSATRVVPVVFVLGSDPVQYGLVASLARPGGNLTGVTVLDADLIAKGLEIIHELLPSATKIALLVNPRNVLTGAVTAGAQIAAGGLGLSLTIAMASSRDEIGVAFARLGEQKVDALLVASDPLFHGNVDELLVNLSAQHNLPTVAQYPKFADAGGLLGYGASLADAFRIGGGYVGRILKGEMPADLPVHQATRIELAVNVGAARRFGLTIPPSLLARADKVIE